MWNPPDWFKSACDHPVLLFLDEIDRATPEVRQGIFELTDSRKINGHVLHKDTVIVAAVNGGEHGAEYQVGEMDPAELDRYTVFDVEPTPEDMATMAGIADEIIEKWITEEEAAGRTIARKLVTEYKCELERQWPASRIEIDEYQFRVCGTGLRRKARQLAADLLALGMKRGDRIAYSLAR